MRTPSVSQLSHHIRSRSSVSDLNGSVSRSSRSASDSQEVGANSKTPARASLPYHLRSSIVGLPRNRGQHGSHREDHNIKFGFLDDAPVLEPDRLGAPLAKGDSSGGKTDLARRQKSLDDDDLSSAALYADVMRVNPPSSKVPQVSSQEVLTAKQREERMCVRIRESIKSGTTNPDALADQCKTLKLTDSLSEIDKARVSMRISMKFFLDKTQIINRLATLLLRQGHTLELTAERMRNSELKLSRKDAKKIVDHFGITDADISLMPYIFEINVETLNETNKKLFDMKQELQIETRHGAERIKKLNVALDILKSTQENHKEKNLLLEVAFRDNLIKSAEIDQIANILRSEIPSIEEIKGGQDMLYKHGKKSIKKLIDETKSAINKIKSEIETRKNLHKDKHQKAIDMIIAQKFIEKVQEDPAEKLASKLTDEARKLTDEPPPKEDDLERLDRSDAVSKLTDLAQKVRKERADKLARSLRTTANIEFDSSFVQRLHDAAQKAEGDSGENLVPRLIRQAREENELLQETINDVAQNIRENGHNDLASSLRDRAANELNSSLARKLRDAAHKALYTSSDDFVPKLIRQAHEETELLAERIIDVARQAQDRAEDLVDGLMNQALFGINITLNDKLRLVSSDIQKDESVRMARRLMEMSQGTADSLLAKRIVNNERTPDVVNGVFAKIAKLRAAKLMFEDITSALG